MKQLLFIIPLITAACGVNSPGDTYVSQPSPQANLRNGQSNEHLSSDTGHSATLVAKFSLDFSRLSGTVESQEGFALIENTLASYAPNESQGKGVKLTLNELAEIKQFVMDSGFLTESKNSEFGCRRTDGIHLKSLSISLGNFQKSVVLYCGEDKALSAISEKLSILYAEKLKSSQVVTVNKPLEYVR